MADREEREHRHHHRRHRKNKENHHQKKKSDKKEEKEFKKEEAEVPHVKLSSEVYEYSICGDGETSGDETKITLTRSEERFRQYLRDSEDERYEKLAREKGWCSNDGIPWGRNQMPKDEAALLKQGVIDRCGARLTPERPPSETRVSFSPSRKYDFSESTTTKKMKKTRKSQKPKEVASLSQSQTSDGTFGTIRCDAGQGKDAGTVIYTVTHDGRNYQLNTNDGHYVHLEFNKKHAYLIVN